MADAGSDLEKALAHHRAGHLAEAQAVYDRLLDASPDDPELLHLRGTLAHQCGHTDEGIGLLERAVGLQPDDHQVLANLGVMLRAVGRVEEAVSAFSQALSIEPENAWAHNNLGNALRARGDSAPAEKAYREAVRLRPDYAVAFANLGMVLLEGGRATEAMSSLQKAISLDPQSAEAHANLGCAYLLLHRPADAENSFNQSLQARPGDTRTLHHLGIALRKQGRAAEAVQTLRRALSAMPAAAHVHSDLILALHYLPGLDPAELHAEYRRFGEIHLRPGPEPALANEPDPNRRLRIGYLGASFRRHPVGLFLHPVLDRHDEAAVETFCYSSNPLADDLTASFRASADHWIDAKGMDDDTLAARIRDDGIDILVHLSGHMENNRQAVLARKPAPLQVGWMGGSGASGLACVDHLIADRFHVPTEGGERFVEDVVSMPNAAVCYVAPEYAPSVVTPPCLTQGTVTFASTNNLPKINDEVVAVWARILHRVQGSRMIVKNRFLDDPAIAQRIAGMFAGHGIDDTRLDLRGASPPAEMLATYNEIDIALDTFPYSGGMTTCEAMWMGVPVITCPGALFTSRHAACHLSNAGFPEFIAETLEGYVDLAAGLAGNHFRLARVRSTMREEMAASPLCDAGRFTRDLEDQYREVWRRWCGGHARPTPEQRIPVESAKAAYRMVHARTTVNALHRSAKSRPFRVILGAGGVSQPWWVATERDVLDPTRPDRWSKVLDRGSVDAFLAEHVWEHLTPEQAVAAARACFDMLRPGGYVRAAIPDGRHPEPACRDTARPEDNDRAFAELFTTAGFDVTLLEYHDEDGRFHFVEWDPRDGMIWRSRRFDDDRRTGNGACTSIIVDAVKPKTS
jgi:protein O-GlcNAc transferase